MRVRSRSTRCRDRRFHWPNASQFLLAALWHRARARHLVGSKSNGPRPAVPVAHLGGEQALHPRTAHEARRNGPGDPAARVLQPRAGRTGLSPRNRHRHADRLSSRRLVDADEDVRPDHAGAAADLSAGLAPARAGDLSEVRAGGAVRHRGLLDVADGHQHDAGGACDPAGLLERRAGPAALEDDHVHEDHRAGNAARTCSPATASVSASHGW